jgi:hypothetical protein
LFSLVLAVAMVGFLIRELNRPQVAMRMDEVMQVAAESAPASNPIPPPVASPVDPAQLQKLLDLAGWDAQHFAAFQQSGPLSDDDRQELVELLWRLRTFDGPQLAAWAGAGSTAQSILAVPSEHPGELVELAGHVTKVERHALPEALATRLEIPAYFECQIALDGGAGEATVITGNRSTSRPAPPASSSACSPRRTDHYADSSSVAKSPGNLRRRARHLFRSVSRSSASLASTSASSTTPSNVNQSPRPSAKRSISCSMHRAGSAPIN